MARLLLLLGTVMMAAAGCAPGGEMRMAGVTPERRDLHLSRTRDEDGCMESAREEVENGSVCGRASRRDRSLDAREARRCALIRCMQAKGYTRYGHDAPARDGW